ncbi:MULTISPECIES: helix-turn-helix transcriptional regulator [Halomonas]|uniref:Helix-turn-helix transcriptional regulator n=1 Tax=Halomonas citrativorans TaxID=2742612 RepID=A0ABR9FCG1_9GAMM|nr:helix-turn-helix transcriptional regulator [Halomonas citrativorans]MBE0404183.1 helix-turn-helix transcriptional regulator [Halomonas citrativorans]
MPTFTSLTPSTLSQLGQTFGIDYLYAGKGIDDPIAQGSVSDLPLSSALHLTLSDLEVRQRYASRSTQTIPWFLSVVIEGWIDITQGQKRLTIGAGQGFCVHFTPQAPLIVEQPAQPQLRTLNIAVLATIPNALPSAQAPQLHAWAPPSTLFAQLSATCETPLDHWRHSLVWQGLALQLLGHGLPTPPAREPQSARGMKAREREQLAQLHTELSNNPMTDYCLSDLARRAAMSPSSLRQKFSALYGCSIFDHLRQCRLQQAYSYLEKGYSVQQTAHTCGYRHATNFTTAFKRLFGIAPTEVIGKARA